MPDEQRRFYPSRDPDAGLKEDRRRFLASATVSLGRPSLFYASLRDPRVFEAVVGRPLDACDWEPVEIHGRRLGKVNAGTGFPGLFRGRDSLSCIIVKDLTAFEQTMIAWYEWDEYALRPVRLADGRSAQAFVPDLEAIRAEHGPFEIEDWSFEAWRASGLERAVAVAHDWMSRRPGNEELVEAGFFTFSEPPVAGRATG